MLTLQEFIALEYLKKTPGPLSQDFRLEFICDTRSDRFAIVRSGNEMSSSRGNHIQGMKKEWPFASISKPIVSMIAMELAEAKELDLDQTFVSALAISCDRIADQSLNSVTIRHLLSHTSGLPAEVNDQIWINLHFPSKQDLVDAFCTATLRSEPATQVGYSNFAFALGALAIERVTNKSVQELWKRLARGDSKLQEIRFSEALEFSSIIHGGLNDRCLQLKSYAPAGAVVSPCVSMAHFMKKVITHGQRIAESDSDSALSRLTTDRNTALLDHEVSAKVGLLWHHTEFQNVNSDVIYHTGTLPGVSSFIIGLPNLELSAAFVANQNLDTKPIMKELIRDLALVDQWTQASSKALTAKAIYEMPHFDSRIIVWRMSDQEEVITLQHYNQSLKIFRRESFSDEAILQTPEGNRVQIKFHEQDTKASFCDQVYIKRETPVGL